MARARAESRSARNSTRETLAPTFELILPFFKSLSSNGNETICQPENAILSVSSLQFVFLRPRFSPKHPSILRLTLPTFPKFAEIRFKFHFHPSLLFYFQILSIKIFLSQIYIHLLVYQRDKRNIKGKGRGFTPLPPPCMEVIDEETVIATSSSDMDVSRAEQWLSPGGVVAESRKQGQKEQH